jgi:PAS domain S-box-containing protein
VTLFLSTSILLIGVGVAGFAVLIHYCWTRRDAPGIRTFLWLMSAVWLWCLTEFVLVFVHDVQAWILIAKLQWIGVLTVPPLWFLFARRYIGKPDLPGPVLVAMSVFVVAGIGLVWTNEGHGLVWSAILQPEADGAIRTTPGLGYFVLALLNWPLIVAGSVAILWSIRRREGIFRRQSAALVAGACLPLVLNVVHAARLPALSSFDPTALGLAISGAVFGWSLYRHHLIDIVPTARDAVIDSMRDALLVLDSRGRMLDANPAARRLLGRHADELIGQAIESVAQDFPELAAALRDGPGGGESMVIGVGPAQSRRDVELRQSMLVDRDAAAIGRLVLMHDVTERKRRADTTQQELERRVEERTHALAVATAQAQEARTDAEGASRAKDEFISMLSHELRNPMAPLANAHRILERTQALDPTGLAVLEMAVRQTTQLRRLVDDLLDTTRITQRKIRLEVEWVDVATLVRQAVQLMSPLAAQRGQPFDVSVPPDAGRIMADPARLRQVLENLLSNALKFTRDADPIRLQVECDADWLEIRVADEGSGIDAASLGRIFELFVQSDATLDRSRGGLGIGLAWVKAIVAMHGGTVSAHSAGRDRGATFVVRLPRAAPHLVGGARAQGLQVDADIG